MATRTNLQFEDPDVENDSIEEEDEISIRVKKLLRKANWNYIHKHPEIRAIIRVLLHELLNKTPTNVYEAAADLFDPEKLDDLVQLINAQLSRINADLKKNVSTEYRADLAFERINDDECEHSRCLLEYALVRGETEGNPSTENEN